MPSWLDLSRLAQNKAAQPEIILPHTTPSPWQAFCSFSLSHRIQIIITILAGLVTISLELTAINLLSTNLHTLITSLVTTETTETTSTDNQLAESPDEAKPTTAPEFINLQPVVDQWRKTTNTNIGLMIYDLDHDQVAAEINPNQVFSVASLYKLFFVYVGYLEIAAERIQSDQPFATTNDYRAGTYTFSECLDLMIRESYNGCADPMRSSQKFYRATENLITDLGLTKTTDGGLFSTAADLTELMKLYFTHPDFSAATWAAIQDSFLNQPATTIDVDTTYDWRQGLPAGFSDQVLVYNKVGWEWDKTYWKIYADAAIIEFPALNRHYTIVVLTSGLREQTPTTIQQLSRDLETAIMANKS